jgi:hypothetical protein
LKKEILFNRLAEVFTFGCSIKTPRLPFRRANFVSRQ